MRINNGKPSLQKSMILQLSSDFFENELNTLMIDSSLTGKIDEVHDTCFLALSLSSFDELVERDDHNGVGPTARGVHVRRRD
jgi:hypothetical protein